MAPISHPVELRGPGAVGTKLMRPLSLSQPTLRASEDSHVVSSGGMITRRYQPCLERLPGEADIRGVECNQRLKVTNRGMLPAFQKTQRASVGPHDRAAYSTRSQCVTKGMGQAKRKSFCCLLNDQHDVTQSIVWLCDQTPTSTLAPHTRWPLIPTQSWFYQKLCEAQRFLKGPKE